MEFGDWYFGALQIIILLQKSFTMSRMQLCLIGSVICMGIMGYFSDFGKLDILDSHFPLWDRQSGPEILRDMGIEGRERYRRLNTVDFVFPLFYATLLADLLKSRGYILGAYISIGAGLFDLMENSCIRILLQGTPSDFKSIALDFGPTFTRLKWGFLSCALILLAFSFIIPKRKLKGK